MLVVVGGHSRNIGKTSVVAGLIHALPEQEWTAVKITQFGHGICSASGSACDCCLGADHPFALVEERAANRSDSGRFLAAGARRSFWLRTAAGQLQNALPAFQQIRQNSPNLIVESNSLAGFVKPDLFLMVLDAAQPDFKESSRRLFDRSDAYVVIERNNACPPWGNLRSALYRSKPRFAVAPPQYVTPALAAFVSERLAGSPCVSA